MACLYTVDGDLGRRHTAQLSRDHGDIGGQRLRGHQRAELRALLVQADVRRETDCRRMASVAFCSLVILKLPSAARHRESCRRLASRHHRIPVIHKALIVISC
jgi:hypothetical protein